MQVSGYGLEADEEAREQEDRDGSDRAYKGGHLGRGAQLLEGDHSFIHPLMSPRRPHLCDSFPTWRELEAAPISSPKDWATKAVAMAKAEKSRKRLVSAGWPVIQYTMLQYTTGHTT